VTRVALVGAGLMGSQIGCEYALAGCEVVWIVRDRAAAQARIDAALERVAASPTPPRWSSPVSG
jgi:3-hydroxyacyl-CoA dehydrogenase